MDPLAPTKLFLGGALTLEGMFNKQQLNNEVGRCSVGQGEEEVPCTVIEEASDEEEEEVNEEDLEGVMSQMGKKEDEGCFGGLDDDELAMMLSQ